MSGFVSGTCQVVRIIVDGAKFVESVRKVATTSLSPSDSQLLRIGTVVLHGITFATNTAGAGASCFGASAKTLDTIKSVEFSSQLCNTPLQMVSAMNRFADGTTSVCEMIEEGFIVPFSSLVRIGIEKEMYYNKHLLSLSPEELAKIREPIYNDDYENPEIIGWKQVTAEECQDRLQNAEASRPYADVVEIMAKTGLVSRTGDKVVQTYQAVYNQFMGVAPAPVGGMPPVIAVAPAVVVPDPLDVDLTQLTYIPTALHNDTVFSKYTCAITLLPIRDPVQDPTTGPHAKTLYERSALVQWLNVHHTSPTTHAPLYVHQLVSAVALKMLIDARLQFHNLRIQQAIQQGLILVPPAPLALAAQVENPNY